MESMDTDKAYRILGLSGDASQEDLKKAYRRKAAKTHPDKIGGDGEGFKIIIDARDVLKKILQEEERTPEKSQTIGKMEAKSEITIANKRDLQESTRRNKAILAAQNKLEEMSTEIDAALDRAAARADVKYGKETGADIFIPGQDDRKPNLWKRFKGWIYKQ